MTPITRAAAASDLAALHAAYARSLSKRLRDLAGAIRAWRRAPDDAREPERHRAETLAHRLRGTSGTYGLRSFSRAIGDVEGALRRERIEGVASAQAVAEIARSLRQARSLAREGRARVAAGTSIAEAARR